MDIDYGYFYAQQVTHVIPSSQRRWVSNGIDFDKWEMVYKRAFKTTASTKLQSLQYRVIHRYFPMRRFLHTRQVVSDPFCDN